MKLTIIPEDGAVYVDGSATLGLTITAPLDVRALQWSGASGWVEHSTGEPNQQITDLPAWALAAVDARASHLSDIAAAAAAADAQSAAAAAQSAYAAANPSSSALLLEIDADTDAIYRAVQGERATEYLLAESDAKSYKAAGYTGTVPDSVASWASAKGQTATWAADDILTTATGWRQAQASIRATRLACKEQARTLPDLGPVAAAWRGFVATIRQALGVA